MTVSAFQQAVLGFTAFPEHMQKYLRDFAEKLSESQLGDLFKKLSKAHEGSVQSIKQLEKDCSVLEAETHKAVKFVRTAEESSEHAEEESAAEKKLKNS